MRSTFFIFACAVLLGSPPVGAQPTLLWLDQFGTSAWEGAFALAADGAGGVFLGGATEGGLGGANQGGADAWLARSSGGPSGGQLWITQIGVETNEYANALAADGAGGVFIAGYTFGSLGGPSQGSTDAWLARYDGDGVQSWLRQLGTADLDVTRSLAPDAAGGAFLTGFTAGSLGGPSQGMFDAFLARYDGAGNALWIKQLGTSNHDWAHALSADGAGGVFITGNTLGDLAGPNQGDRDTWLARHDAAGNQVWVVQIGTTGWDEADALAADGAGGVFVAGYTSGSLGGPIQGGTDAWLAHYDGSGNQLWIRQFGGSGLTLTVARALAADGLGGVFVAGYTGGALAGPSHGELDAWLAGYSPTGTQTGLVQLGTAAVDEGSALASDGAGGVYLAGITGGSLGAPQQGSSDAFVGRFVSGVCYPDCNGDGSLNLADFGCFQTRFALGDPFADCNGDASLNLADFGCFQTHFAAGCP